MRWLFLFGPLVVGLVVWAWHTKQDQDDRDRVTIEQWKALLHDYDKHTQRLKDELARRRTLGIATDSRTAATDRAVDRRVR